MNYADDLRRVFGERLKRICQEELDQAIEKMRENIRNNKTNSGNRVNYLNLPASTTGNTEDSLHVEVEEGDTISVSIVGRDYIRNIDKGNSPEDIHEEYMSFESFYRIIEEYSRNKEQRYNLGQGSINAYKMAMKLWEDGAVLYRAGGGKESLREPAEMAVNRIIERVTPELDRTIYDNITNMIYDI